jgi:hypothetical protein
MRGDIVLILRYSLLNTSVLTNERVGGLAAVKRNDVTGPLGTVDGQDRAKDQLCVRLSSTRLSQLELVGVKWKWKRGWRNSQLLIAGVLWVP